MASIEKRGKSYRIIVSLGYDENKKQIKIKSDPWTPDPGMTEKKIEKYLETFKVEFEQAIKNGSINKFKNVTFRTLSTQFFSDPNIVLARTTRPDYRKRLELRILPAFGHLSIAEINTPTINAYTKMIKENYTSKDGKNKKLSDASIKKDCAVISSVLSYAVEQGYITINPLIYSGKQNRRKKGNKEYKVKYYETEELNAFLWALENSMPVYHSNHTAVRNGENYKIKEYTQIFSVSLKWKLFFYISLFCGSRRGENISLTWKDFDFKKNTIKIDKSTDYVEKEMQLKETKINNSRDNTLPTYIMELAQKLKTEQKQQCMLLGDKWEAHRGKDFDKNFIFIQDDGKQMHITSPYRQYKRIIRIYNEYATRSDLAPIPDDVSMHGLRHSAAAILIAAEMDPRSVADILGHANPSTTLNIYSYFFKDKGIAAANIMEETFLKKTK